jgi:ceramide glucosyltransferase
MKIGPSALPFLFFLAGAAVFSVLGTVLAILHRLRVRPDPDETTPVTILKPLAGTFPDLRGCLESFFVQTHRQFQIVIGVRTWEDPAREVAEELRRAHPDIDCVIVTAGPDLGPNRKVTSLHYMMELAKYPLLMISDDDVRVSRDYLARMVGALRNPRVGVVTSPYWVRPRSLPLALDALTRATEFLPSVLTAERLEGGLSFTLGASTLFRRKTLEDIGGVRACADYLAEDYHFGSKARGQGWQLRLGTESVELAHEFRSLRDYLEHQIRWARTYRFCRPMGYFFSILTQGTFLSLVFIGGSGASRLSLVAAGCFLAVRLLGAAVDALLLGRASLLLWLPLLPLRDLLATLFWAASFLGKTVRWRGRVFRLGAGGRLHLAD